jgi:hypothetical protein
MSKYKNFNSGIIYYILKITLEVSSIGTHAHLLALEICYSIIRLYCLQPIVLGIILMNLTQGMSEIFIPFCEHLIANKQNSSTQYASCNKKRKRRKAVVHSSQKMG